MPLHAIIYMEGCCSCSTSINTVTSRYAYMNTHMYSNMCPFYWIYKCFRPVGHSSFNHWITTFIYWIYIHPLPPPGGTGMAIYIYIRHIYSSSSGLLAHTIKLAVKNAFFYYSKMLQATANKRKSPGQMSIESSRRVVCPKVKTIV
jgi:hypothetical protein